MPLVATASSRPLGAVAQAAVCVAATVATAAVAARLACAWRAASLFALGQEVEGARPLEVEQLHHEDQRRLGGDGRRPVWGAESTQ